MRRAFTLLETMLAATVLVAVIAGVLATATSTMQIARLGSAQDELADDGRKALQAINDDLSLAGWYLPSDQTPALVNFPTTMNTVGSVPGDRDVRYYPYVLTQEAAFGSQFPHLARTTALKRLTPPLVLPPPTFGRPSDYDAHWSTGFTDRTETDGSCYSRNYFAPSQEIVFIRSQQSANIGDDGFISFAHNDPDAWQKNPSAPTASGVLPHEALGILSMAEWRRAADEPVTTNIVTENGKTYRVKPRIINGAAVSRAVPDIVLPSSWLNVSTVMPVMNWETIEPLVTTGAGANITGGNVLDGAGSPGIATAKLREFTFAVIPGVPGRGLGRLVRAHKVANPPVLATGTVTIGSCIARDGTGTYGMVVDRILSEHVVRVVFDTYRTLHHDPASATASDPQALEINQVRVRLFLMREYGAGGHELVCQMLEQVMTMRGRSGDAEYTADYGALVDRRSTADPTYFFPR